MKNQNSEELKLKHIDEAGRGYFAAEFNNQWYRVEPFDSPIGAANRVNIIYLFNVRQFLFSTKMVLDF